MKTMKLLLVAGLVFCNLCVYSQSTAKKETQSKSQKTSVVNKRPKMAIEYFAEFDLIEKGEFGVSHANDEGKHFRDYEAAKACPQGWHLPTAYELSGIVPRTGWRVTNGIQGNIIIPLRFFSGGSDLVNWPEHIQVGKNDTAKFYLGDFSYVSGKNNYIAYALRFKKDNRHTFDNKMLTAYRYAMLGVNTSKDGGNVNPGPAFRLEVTCRYLGENFDGTIGDISSEEYWASNKDNDVVRVFSAGGAYNSLAWKPGKGGYYMSSTKNDMPWVEYDDLVIGERAAGNLYFLSFGAVWGEGGAANIQRDGPADLKMFVRCVRDQ